MPTQRSSSGTYNELQLALTSVSFSSDNQSKLYTSSSFASDVLIDLGTSVITLPNDIFNHVLQDLGTFEYTEQVEGLPALPCRYGDDPTAMFTFGFNGPDGALINVPLSDLLLTSGRTLDDGNEVCYLEMEADPGVTVFGDIFLRHTYAVFDLEGNQIALAQAKFDVTSSNILEISEGSIPRATTAASIIKAGSSSAIATPSASSSTAVNTVIPNAAPPASFQFTITATASAAATRSGSASHSSMTSGATSALVNQSVGSRVFRLVSVVFSMFVCSRAF